MSVMKSRIIPKTEYDIEFIAYTAYGIHHRLHSISGNKPSSAGIHLNNLTENNHTIPLRHTIRKKYNNQNTFAGLILDLRPANQRCRYKVTSSLIGWAQT